MQEISRDLVVENVTKTFDGFVAIKDLSLRARAGRVFGMIGPNGAGKTTTMRMIVNITAPDAGRIEFMGSPVGKTLQDRIGYLPEERGLYKKMKIGEQLRFFGELKDYRGKLAEERIDLWLTKFGLADWKDKKAIELSKGMQQKVQFIAAVMHDPDLLILDEPFSGLDPISVELLKNTVIELKNEGKTIILSTHQMDLAEKLCDDVCLIDRSRKILDGSLREVKRRFGRNAVTLRVEGGGEVLGDLGIVAKIVRGADESEALLANGVDAQSLLRRLVDSGAVVSKFQMVEASLNDIFIEKVGESR